MATEQVRPVRDANYYLQEHSLTEPRFEGKGAKLLGIDGVSLDTDEGRKIYLNLFDGYTTDDQGDRDKKLPKYMHSDRRGAFDLTTNNPKDVSIVNLVGGDRRIDAVILEARKAVSDEVERQARVRVTKKSEVEASKAKMPKGWKRPERRPENLVMVWFDHSSSRLEDAHRHGHLWIANVSYDKQEKTWKALELGHLDQQKIADIYRDTMRKGLHQLGYKTEREGKEYRITGFPAEVKGVFSQRGNGIVEMRQEMEARTGKPMSAKAKSKLPVYDRPEKPADKPLPERQKSWRDRLSPGQLKAVFSFVNKAKAVVKSRGLGSAFSRWQSDISRHASKLRRTVLTPETESPERSRNDGRSR
jgi:conjugative relaxase-like TrwC/TraI family protein